MAVRTLGDTRPMAQPQRPSGANSPTHSLGAQWQACVCGSPHSGVTEKSAPEDESPGSSAQLSNPPLTPSQRFWILF